MESELRNIISDNNLASGQSWARNGKMNITH